MLVALSGGERAAAEETAWATTIQQAPRLESWTGGAATADAWSFYGGITYAPFSAIDEAGWRVRTVGGGGAFRYRKDGVSFESRTGFADLLAGYQWRSGPLTAKAFGGVTMLGTVSSPLDPDVEVLDGKVGAKAVAELWLNLGDYAFLQADTTLSDVGPLLAARARLGASVLPWLSLGPEIKAYDFADTQDEIGGGAFVRMAWGATELSIAAGSLAIRAPGGTQDAEPYAMVNLSTRR